MYLNPFPNAFGLDISDLSIKLVQLRNASHQHRHPSFQLVTARQTRMPKDLIINGVLEQPEKVRKYLNHLLKMESATGSIKSPWVVASVPDTQGYMKLLQIDKDEEDIIEEDIIYAAKKDLPFDEENDYIDWQVIPPSGVEQQHTSVLIATIPKKIADMYTYLLESVGLVVIALEIQSLATARAMITAKKDYSEEARAVLDIGSSKTTLIVHDFDHLQFSRTLPYSGEMVTEALIQKLHLTYDQAEERKKQYGLVYENNPAWQVMIEITDQLINSIKQTIQFYYTHFPNSQKITHITMCGGGSALKGLDKILTHKLGIETEPGSVWKNLFSKHEIKVDKRKELGMSTAIGLALRAADNPFFIKNII